MSDTGSSHSRQNAAGVVGQKTGSPRKARRMTMSTIDGIHSQFLNPQFAVWTVNDQKKLASLDGLYERVMEFHRNVHSKESALTLFPPTGAGIAEPRINDFDSSTIVATVTTFSSDKSKKLFQQMTYIQFYTFCHNTFKAPNTPKSHKHNRDVPAMDYYWVYLKDLNALDIFINLLDMHELIAAGFHDLRSHSSVLQGDNELFLSNVTCSLDGFKFKMHKMFMYLKDNLLVTHESELFPDLDENEDAATVLAAVSGISSSTLASSNTVHTPLKDPVTNKENNSNKNLPPPSVDMDTLQGSIASGAIFMPPITDRVMQLFFGNIGKLKKKLFELGTFYIVYEISLQLLGMYDSAVEFISSSLSYFNRVVHLNLLHRERMAMMIKIHMLSAGISLVRRSLEGCVEIFSKLADISHEVANEHFHGNEVKGSFTDHIPESQQHKNNANFPSFGSPAPNVDFSDSFCPLITREHDIYIADIVDCFHFKRNSAQKQNDEIRRIESELDATIALRTTNTNTLLSLIATTFLPLTFFAGVFGMNFTVDGGYTIDLLNVSYGPTVFIVLCMGELSLSVCEMKYLLP
jgi:Mg2+ and Co2+ transporter CorA